MSEFSGNSEFTPVTVRAKTVADVAMTEKQLLRKAIAVAMFKKLHPNWDWAWHFDEYERMWPGSSRKASYTSVGECVALADVAMALCRADEK